MRTKRRTWVAWAALAGLAVGCGAPAYHVCPIDALIRCSREPIPDVPAPPVPVEPFAADREPGRPLTLPDLLAMAEERSPDLAQARARVEAARGRLIQAGYW